MKRILPDEWKPRGVKGLEPAAFDAVRDLSNSMVVAGPGAGKTELLAQRASYLLETGLCPPPYRILAISFKRDAAKNLRDRVALRCGPELARRFESYTFDAWAKSLLDRFRPSLPALYRPGADYTIDPKFTNDLPFRERLFSVCEEAGVSRDKVHQIDLGKFFAKWISGMPIEHELTPTPNTGSALTVAVWKSALHSGARSVVAFPMIGVLAELLLRTNPPLLKTLQMSYRFVFLDEFQDTTSSQFRLLNTAFHGSPASLTAVGDNKQRIMLWAGALVGVFAAYEKNFAAQKHDLVMNYRSAPRLVAIQQHLISALEPGSPPPQAADDGENGEGECRLLLFNNDTREAETLAEFIGDWIEQDGLNPNDICILVRQRPDVYTEQLCALLAERGVSARVQNEFQDLLAEPLTIAALSAIRVCVSQAPDEWTELSNLTLRLRGYDGSDDDEATTVIHGLSRFLKELRPFVKEAKTEEEITTVIKCLLDFLDEATFTSIFEQYLQPEFLQQTTEALVKHLHRYRSENVDWPTTLDTFEGHDSLPIMSIHKSKGLEFHTVIVLGLEDYPFRGLASGNGEEDCNFFVAFSRAKKRVLFTSAKIRTTSYGPRPQGLRDVRKFYELLGSAGVPLETIE